MKFSAVSGWGLIATAVLLAAACDGESSSEGTADESMPGVPEAQVAAVRAALTPVADAFCRQQFGCCSEGELASTFGASIPDATTCSQEVMDRAQRLPYLYFTNTELPELFRSLGWLAYGFALEHAAIDQAGVDACVAELNGTACATRPAGDFCVAQPVRTSSACDPRKVFVGTLDEGTVCNSNASGIDCKPGLFCSSFDGPQGVCLAHLKEGDICSVNGSWYGECGPQMLCDPQRGVCTQGIAEGQPCAYVAPEEPRGGTEVSACAPGLSCDATRLVCADRRCYSGKSCSQDKECPEGHVCAGNYCKPPAKDGENCLEADDCANKDCVYYPEHLESFCGGIFPDGSDCNGSRQCASGYCKFGLDGFGMCAAQGAVGSECEPGSAGSCLNGQCMYNESSFTYVCAAAGGEGDACLGNACRDGFACIEGVCHKPPFADGLFCDSNSACISGFCSSGMCMTRAPAGAACLLNADPAQCADGLYCGPSTQLSLTGVCQAKLRQGELCTEHYQCWENCDVIAGKRRCRGVGPSDAWCSGR